MILTFDKKISQQISTIVFSNALLESLLIKLGGSLRELQKNRTNYKLILSNCTVKTADAPVCIHAESTSCERDRIYIAGADSFVISSQNEL